MKGKNGYSGEEHFFRRREKKFCPEKTGGSPAG